MKTLGGIVLSLILSMMIVACGDDDGEDDITKACKVMVIECNAQSKGLTMDECLQGMPNNSVNCMKCILGLTEPCKLDGTSPNYIKICHDPSNNCDIH